MENRKTKTIKLEIYEDRELEFRAMVWLLKSNFNEFGIKMIRNFYDDPSIFDHHIKEYVDFIKDFMSMIYVPTIDGEVPIPSVVISPVSYAVMSSEAAKNPLIELREMTGDSKGLGVDKEPDYVDEVMKKKIDEMIGANRNINYVKSKEEIQIRECVLEFIGKSSTISNFLNASRQNDLVEIVVHLIKTREIQYYQTDKFWEAAWTYKRHSRLIDTDIKRLIFSPFSFRYSSNVVFQERAIHTPKQIQSWEKYRLAGDIYQHLEFWFPELATCNASNDYQLRLITGLVLSCIKKKGKKSLLNSEDDFLEKPNLKKSKKTWREYLADYTLNWLKMANKLGFEKYPSERKAGEFYK